MNTDLPLVCNMGVFTPAERAAHIQTTTELMQAIQEVQEVDNGYALMFPNETALIPRIAEFISKERLCCPFLKFTLTVDLNRAPISLSLTGPLGTREFLRAEFDGVFS